MARTGASISAIRFVRRKGGVCKLEKVFWNHNFQMYGRLWKKIVWKKLILRILPKHIKTSYQKSFWKTFSNFEKSGIFWFLISEEKIFSVIWNKKNIFKKKTLLTMIYERSRCYVFRWFLRIEKIFLESKVMSIWKSRYFILNQK